MIFNKRGEMTTENVVELIIAIACLVVLVGIAVVMLIPGHNEVDKTTEAYLEKLSDAVKVASFGETGNFFMLDDGDKDVDFYLVYFGDGYKCEEKDIKFIRSIKGGNMLCVCSSEKDKIKCGYCLELEAPLRFDEKGFFGEGSGACSIREGFRKNIDRYENKEYGFNDV